MCSVRHAVFDHYNAFLNIALAKQETAPIANPGPDRTVHAADIITLDVSKSLDRDGDPITKYQWEEHGCCNHLFVGSTSGRQVRPFTSIQKNSFKGISEDFVQSLE